MELIETNMDNETMIALCSLGICQSQNLQYLDLRNNIFDEKGLIALVKALKKHMTLKFLFLEDLKFSKKQASMLADFLGEENCKIEQLSLN